MSGARPHRDHWEIRLNRVRRVAPVPLLVVASVLAALTVSEGFHSWERYWFGLAVAAVAAGWAIATRSEPASEEAAGLRFAVHSVLAATLVGVNPWYGLYAFTGYLLAGRLPTAGMRVGVVITALIVAASQIAGYPAAELGSIAAYLIVAAVNAVLALTFMSISDHVLDQNRERGTMIEQLNRTNGQLQAALQENAGLHAQLVTQAREAGVLDERQRLAGEIHDTLAQALIGIVTQLEAAQQARHLSEQWQRHVGQAGALARTALGEARRSVQALRPEQLEDASLLDAVAALAAEWSRISGIRTQLDTTGPVRAAGTPTETTLFRVAQEALANVQRHAHAAKVWLTLSYLTDTLVLDVRDDGTGFDPTAPRVASATGGYGLNAMRQRVRRVGGTLAVESAVGEGTVISAALPIGSAL